MREMAEIGLSFYTITLICRISLGVPKSRRGEGVLDQDEKEPYLKYKHMRKMCRMISSMLYHALSYRESLFAF